jgi:hypothetical protein
MLAETVHRARQADAAPVLTWPGVVPPPGPVTVAAFKHRWQAERAIRALQAAGCPADQIQLEGPAAGWPLGAGSVLGGALLGAAVGQLARTRGHGWLGGALGLPALGLSALAALTALGNPRGVEHFPWRVTAPSGTRVGSTGGILRASGARAVHQRHERDTAFAA